MPLVDLVPDIYYQDGMNPCPKLICTVDRHGEVSCDDTGCLLVGACVLSRFGESNLILLDWQTGECLPGCIGCDPLREGQ